MGRLSTSPSRVLNEKVSALWVVPLEIRTIEKRIDAIQLILGQLLVDVWIASWKPTVLLLTREPKRRLNDREQDGACSLFIT